MGVQRTYREFYEKFKSKRINKFHKRHRSYIFIKKCVPTHVFIFINKYNCKMYMYVFFFLKTNGIVRILLMLVRYRIRTEV